MFRKLMCGAVVMLLVAVIAQAETITIQRGTYGTVADAYIRDNNWDEPGWDENMNFGNPADPYAMRVYGDAGGIESGKGERHMLISFDLSGIPAGSTITSATFGEYYWEGNGTPDITDMKVSRLQPGKSWIEGTGDTSLQWVDGFAVANAGEPTFNERMYGSGGWQVAGATGAGDIDLATTKSFDLWDAEWNLGFRTVDVTDFVDGWVNGGWENNGMLLWGGTTSSNSSDYWLQAVSEDETIANRPYLTINYIPEPATLAMLALGAGLLLRRRR